VRHERLIELMVVQANDVVTQPSRSGLVHREPLPAVNTEGLMGVPDVAANSNEKHSMRPFSMYGTKVGVTACTASVPWGRLVHFHLLTQGGCSVASECT